MAVLGDFSPQRINASHDHEIVRWARVFDDSPEQIRRAIDCVGCDAGAVRAFLKERQATLDFGPMAGVAARAASAAG